MRAIKIAFLFSAFFIFAPVLITHAGAQAFYQRQLPEFTSSSRQDWINSAPLKREDLKGGVTLVYFWTFDCWNSYRSFPWLRGLEKRFGGNGFQAIGVHTPEFEHEKSRRNLEEKMREFKVSHPVMMDNNFYYWRKMNNRYWPTFYIVDRDGKIVHKMIGETHIGQERAKEFEKVLERVVKQ
ncbi:MAG: redoxin domain-containing protein [Candidatus Mycalebacterium zealandia]|nr:MAG: redoxin domain-containing protein [Candidatus Mycalebacterium zealandia]